LAGNPSQLGIQAVAVVATLLFSGVASFALLKAISVVVSLKVSTKDEGLGLDVSQHGEEAYAKDDGAILLLPRSPEAVPIPMAAVEGGRA
jgi:Amt family ammonium transporter